MYVSTSVLWSVRVSAPKRCAPRILSRSLSLRFDLNMQLVCACARLGAAERSD